MEGLFVFARQYLPAIVAFVTLLAGALIGDPNVGVEQVIAAGSIIVAAGVVYLVPAVAGAEKAIAVFVVAVGGAILNATVTGNIDSAEIVQAVSGLVAAIGVAGVGVSAVSGDD